MKGYLATMNVDPLAIEAHEKGEKENDTIHTIELDRRRVKITKRSRVNNDLVVDLELGKESVEYLPPGDRKKTTLAQSDNPGHLCIRSGLHTSNGEASVVDTKTLLQETDKTVLRQELTITNVQSGQTQTTFRHFNPYLKTPPHLAAAAEAENTTT